MNSRRLISHPSRKDRTRIALLHSRFHPSINRVAAGASGFLTLIQSGERPERYGVTPLGDDTFGPLLFATSPNVSAPVKS
jgi:hypothetical protein